MGKDEKKDGKPQLAVINSLLEDQKTLDFNVEILMQGEFLGKDATTDNTEKSIKFKVENLPLRHKAFIQIMRRDNYYRNLRKSIHSTLHWIVGQAREAFELGEVENALELTLCYESKMQEIFQECYQNHVEFTKKILDSVSKMRIIPMQGGFGKVPGYGEILGQDRI